MQAILAYVGQILAVVTEILGIVGIIREQTKKTAVEHVPYAIETIAANGTNTLIHPTWGLHAILNAIAALNTRLDTTDFNIAGVYTATQVIIDDIAALPAAIDYTETLQAILDAINGLVIPSEPPNVGEIASEVWDTASGMQLINADYTALSMQQIVNDIWSVASFTAGHVGLPVPLSPYFSIVVWEPWKLADSQFNWPDFNTEYAPPTPVWSDVLVGDSPYVFLSRTQAAFGWTTIGPTGLGTDEVAWKSLGGSGIETLWVRSTFTSLDMHQLAALTPPPVIPPIAILTAPVWPGVADVTLGTPVALADQLVVTAAMDGVIVSVTTPPQKLGSYHLGNATLDYGAGRMAFETDDGQLESWQYLGFREAIYTPKTMLRASKVRFQVMGGALGTVTPWTKS